MNSTQRQRLKKLAEAVILELSDKGNIGKLTEAKLLYLTACSPAAILSLLKNYQTLQDRMDDLKICISSILTEDCNRAEMRVRIFQALIQDAILT